MSSLRLILASLLFHWRMNFAVACGVAAAAAVLTGALLVGDSMRGSLRQLTFDRLGPIDEVLLAGRFFREPLAGELSGELAEQADFKEHFQAAVPVIIVRASLEVADQPSGRRVNKVNLIGCDARFWALDEDQAHQLTGNQIVLNEPLAERLDVDQRGTVIVRLGGISQIPAESLLGKTDAALESMRLTVAAKIPAEKGLGRFSLRPGQRLPLNAYVSLEALQRTLQQPGRVNAVLVTGKTTGDDPPPGSHELLQDLLHPTLEDYGLDVERTDRADLSYFNITSDQIVLPKAVEKEISRVLEKEELQPVLTYLANKIDARPTDPNLADPSKDTSGIAYSTISAIDFTEEPPWGPLRALDGSSIASLDDTDDKKKIVLNQWAFDELMKPELGDTLYVTYFKPESTHGRSIEQTEQFELAGVVQLDGAAKDRHLTPTIPKVTEADSLADWEPPFQPFYPSRLDLENEDGSDGPDEVYWDEHGATPKAFVSLAVGRELWGSRFGQTTSIRVRPRQGITVESLTEQLVQGPEALDPAALGFVFEPVKQQGLAASAGTTPFSVLFLSFSFFLIAAAMMLVALLFRLAVEQRTRQLGILVAVGFGRGKIVRLLAAEGLLIAALGSLLGVPIGIGYAALMLLGLRTWWLAAVVTPFLRLHLTPPGHNLPISPIIGFASGLIVALLAIVWAVWQTRHVAPRQLLAGRMDDASSLVAGRPRYAGKLAATVMLLAAVTVALAAMRLGEEMQALAFFGAGALVLIAVLTFVRALLRSGATGPAVTAGRGNLLRIGLRNAARNPGRSTLSIGLVASACFLIVAVSAFHLDPAGQVPKKDGGGGGFAVVAQSDQPIYHDLDTPEGRGELGFSDADSRLLADCRTIALRVKPGDDASCLNLYQPRQPRVLGVARKMIERGGFAWAGSDAQTPEQTENPWLLLNENLGTDDDGTPLVPVVIDKNTAMYSLHLYQGVGQTYEVTDGQGIQLRLKVVGLLAGSIFQGDLLIGPAAFRKHFPEVSGYRFFLTEATPDPTKITPEKTQVLQNALENALGDYGLASETTGERLAGFLAVQNTYLLTFQSLGGLGLLLGTFGLAAVQLRNVLQRRGELALMRAAGFRRSTLAQMVMLENGLLLVAGLGGGLLAALVAVLPHLVTRAASIPWLWLAGTLGLVLAVGLIAGLAAVRVILTAPLLAALRQE